MILRVVRGPFLGSAQDQSRNDCALGCYHLALQQLARAGYADCERSSVVHNSLGTLHERLAGAPDPGDPDWQAKPMPHQFSPAAEAHFSEAVRHYCISLRWHQKDHGELHYLTAAVHQNIAGMCSIARIWTPYFKHHQAARIGMHVSLGPRHPESVRADLCCQLAVENAPSSRAAVLAPGLERELTQLAKCRACWHCHLQEDAVLRRFQCCKRCSMALYCSRECQRSDWKKHRKACRFHIVPVGKAVEADLQHVKESGLRKAQSVIQLDMVRFGKATLAELFELKGIDPSLLDEG